MSELQGRTAIVCGSTQGIGKASAHRLADMGATIVLVARNADKLADVRKQLPGDGHRTVAVDFSSWRDVEAAVGADIDAHGGAEILINNSGGPPAGPAHAAEVDAFAQAFEQHLLCSQAIVRLTVPAMRAAGYGRIVNIISTSVVTPIRNLGVSNTVRGAVANWGRTLAGELAADGITVNNVLPGFTDTGRLRSLISGRAGKSGATEDEVAATMAGSVPAGRFGTTAELAAVIGFLASQGAAYVNGVNLPVDGGRVAMR